MTALERLKATYDAVLDEPIPEEWIELLLELEGQPSERSERGEWLDARTN